ncbi:hypothetical protein V1291_003882 [Nitrobacteraceae bacterium AZCC 1564]
MALLRIRLVQGMLASAKLQITKPQTQPTTKLNIIGGPGLSIDF